MNKLNDKKFNENILDSFHYNVFFFIGQAFKIFNPTARHTKSVNCIFCLMFSTYRLLNREGVTQLRFYKCKLLFRFVSNLGNRNCN